MRPRVVATLALVVAFAGVSFAAELDRWSSALHSGNRLVAEGRYSEGEAVLAQALAYAKAFGQEDPRLALTLHDYGFAHLQLGNVAEAQNYFRSAARIYAKTAGNDVEEAVVLQHLGSAEAQLGDLAGGERTLKRALDLQLRVLAVDDPQVAMTRTYMAQVLIGRRSYEAAREQLVEALSACEKRLGDNHPYTAVQLNDLAFVNRLEGKHREAAPLFERALGILERAYGADHPLLVTTLNNVAVSEVETGAFDDAEKNFKRALELARNGLAPNSAELGLVMTNYAILLKKTKRGAEAKQMKQQAKVILAAHRAANPPGFIIDASGLSSFR